MSNQPLLTVTSQPLLQTEKKDRPTLGKIYFVLSGILQCFSFMCGKLLFEHHERLLPAPMLVYRATLSAIFLACWLNASIKKTLYDDLSPKTLFPLSVRVIAGNLSVFVNFMSVKFF